MNLPPPTICLQWHGDGDPEEGNVCEYVSKDALQDPVRTHAMMMRGEIIVDKTKIRHFLGDNDLLEILHRCEGWLSTLPEGRKMQAECQRAITAHTGKLFHPCARAN